MWSGDLFEYIENRLDQDTAERLYANCRWSALGVLQHLDGLSKQVVIRLVAVNQKVQLSFL